MINIKVLLSLLFINFSVLLSQTTYYISSSEGNDSNNGTSESSPWKSLNKLHSSWNQIGPGDKILFKRGDEWAPSDLSYSDGVGVIRIPNWKDGTSSNYITMGAYGSGSLPNLSGKNLGSSYHQVIRTGPLHYWKFENLRFEGNISFHSSWGDDQNPDRAIHHVEINYCEFDGRINRSTGISFSTGWSIYEHTKVPLPNNYSTLGWYPATTNNVIIKGNKFWSSGGEDCINMICVGDSIYVGYNEFYGSNEEFLDIAGGVGHVVEYNFATGSNGNGMKFHSQFSVLSDLVFRGNIIIKGSYLNSSSGNAAAFENVVNSKIYNNTLVGYENGWSAWFGDMDRSGLYAYYGTFDNNVIKNNIFYGTVGIYGIWNNVSDGRFFTDNEISNNTYYLIPNNDLYYAIRIRKASGDVQIRMDQQSLFYDEWQSKASGGTTERMENPQVVNPYWNSPSDFGDFSLAQGSSSINSGTEIEDYTNDIRGTSVPQDGITDRGAYEFHGIDSTPPKINSLNVIDFSNLVILFSESIQKESAEDIKNYQISPGSEITLINAELQSDSKSVYLTTSQQEPGNYTLEANNIFDLAGNIIDPEANTIPYLISSTIDTTVIVQYDFTQGETPGFINDISGGDNQVDLIIENVADVEWLQPNGISINSPTKILSKHPAKKITDACIQTGEISVAVWLKPHTLNQNGPARIASLSENANVRNFTLGHGGANGVDDVFDFRLRTTESNSNGLPSVTTQPGYMSASSPNHLVYTRDKHGVSKIFINSIEIESANIGGDFSNWDNTYHFIIGNEFTGDRPWLGEIYDLAIYDVALSKYKIDSLYSVNVITNTNDDAKYLPNNFMLEQNFPNPFNPTTSIKFNLPAQSIGAENKSGVQVQLIIYDILGNKITTLMDEYKTPGIYEVEFNGEALSSGIYFYKIDAGIFQSTKKMILLK